MYMYMYMYMYMNEAVHLHVHAFKYFVCCRELNIPTGCIHPVTGTRLELILPVSLILIW